MARADVTVQTLALDEGVNVSSYGDFDYTNGMQVEAVEPTSSLLLHVKSVAGGDITVKSGVYERGAIGDLTVTLPAGESWIGPFESSRFKQADDKVYLDTALTDVTILGVQLPH